MICTRISHFLGVSSTSTFLRLMHGLKKFSTAILRLWWAVSCKLCGRSSASMSHYNSLCFSRYFTQELWNQCSTLVRCCGVYCSLCGMSFGLSRRSCLSSSARVGLWSGMWFAYPTLSSTPFFTVSIVAFLAFTMRWRRSKNHFLQWRLWPDRLKQCRILKKLSVW